MDFSLTTPWTPPSDGVGDEPDTGGSPAFSDQALADAGLAPDGSINPFVADALIGHTKDYLADPTGQSGIASGAAAAVDPPGPGAPANSTGTSTGSAISSYPHEDVLKPVPAPTPAAPAAYDESQDPPTPVSELVVTAPRRAAQGAATGSGPGLKPLLDRISMGEGTSDDAARQHGLGSGYDVTLAYGGFAQPSKPVSQMTLSEINDLQQQMLRNPANTAPSSAVGRYQIVRRTLLDLQRQMHLTGDEVFSPDLQDRLAAALLERRGLSRLQNGQISPSQYQDNLSNEWASIARPNTGRTRAGATAATSTAQIQPELSNLVRR